MLLFRFFLFNFSLAIRSLFATYFFYLLNLVQILNPLCMEKHVHYSEQETFEANDWRPWVILGLLALVITFALVSY